MELHVDIKVEQFIKSLETHTIAKTVRTIDLLEKFGPRLGMPHSKKVVDGLFELRMRGNQEVRILYCFYKNDIHLLHGFIKKSQKTPHEELQYGLAKYKRLTGL